MTKSPEMDKKMSQQKLGMQGEEWGRENLNLP